MAVNLEYSTPIQNRSELSRFIQIVKRHAKSSRDARKHLRSVIVAFLQFSPNTDELIDALIQTSIALNTNESLDIAIDVLSQLGETYQNFAFMYLQTDIAQWSKLYPERKFEPNQDYWYVLLRAVGKCGGDASRSVSILSVCQDRAPRVVAEAVVEGLGDIGNTEAMALLRNIKSTHSDEFIRNLAEVVLEDCN